MKTNKPRVAVASGEIREQAVHNALELVHDEICAKVRGTVLIKPNFLSSVDPVASTRADAVRPVLRLLRGVDTDAVLIGEGAARSTPVAFKNFGYEDLAREFGSTLVDLNRDSYSGEFELLTQTRGRHVIQYSDIAGSADTIVSVAVAKTHNFSTVTLSLKNMMGCLRRVCRPRMHGNRISGVIETVTEKLWNYLERYPRLLEVFFTTVFAAQHASRYIPHRTPRGVTAGFRSQVRALSENLVRLGTVLMQDVAVIDAFEAMEGNGPGRGTPVKMGIAVAGTAPISCDAVMAHLMGFDPMEIGYLALAHEAGLGCARLDDIEILGEETGHHARTCRPHSTNREQLKWRDAWKEL